MLKTKGIRKFEKRLFNSFKVILSLVCFNLIVSCVTQRKIEYIQDRNKDVISFDESEYPDYTLKSNDELYININSLDEEAANVFARSVRQESMSPYSASLMSHSVDKEGNLFLPLVGKVYVKGKTLSEVSMILRDSLIHVLNQPIVTVKLVNRYVSVLGEVRTPGHFPYSQDKLTVLDAIALAGDVTEYGNRDNVLILRNENNKNYRINVNLTNSEILESPYYFIRPNDIIYIKPMRRKFWGMREFPFAILFSTITTGLLIYNVWR